MNTKVVCAHDWKTKTSIHIKIFRRVKKWLELPFNFGGYCDSSIYFSSPCKHLCRSSRWKFLIWIFKRNSETDILGCLFFNLTIYYESLFFRNRYICKASHSFLNSLLIHFNAFSLGHPGKISPMAFNKRTRAVQWRKYLFS